MQCDVLFCEDGPEEMSNGGSEETSDEGPGEVTEGDPEKMSNGGSEVISEEGSQLTSDIPESSAASAAPSTPHHQLHSTTIYCSLIFSVISILFST